MIALGLVLLAGAAERPAVVSVHAADRGGRAAVEVVTTSAPVRLALDRSASEAVLTLEASLPAALGGMAPVAPVQAIEVKKTSGGVAIHVRVARSVPHEIQRQGTLLTVLFGESAGDRRATPGSDVHQLYRGLLPPNIGDDPVRRGAHDDRIDADVTAGEIEGLRLGPFTVRPSLSAVYVDAENALLETAEPLADQFYEIRPYMAAEMPLGLGRLRGDYEARLREESRFAIVEQSTTHLANANLEMPLGPNLLARANGHFARGLLETTEVDPGREYFFQLGRYRRYDAGGGLRMQTAGRLDLDLAGAYYSVDLDDDAGFFDYEGRSGTAGIGLEVGPRLRATLAYTYDEIPSAAERLEARMRAHSASVGLQGEVLPLVTGHVTVGYRDQRNPEAGPGGTRYRGLSASASLLKEFSPSTTLRVIASRSTPPSGFESNGFFVATSVLGELNVALPFSFVALAGAGHHHNAYRVVSVEIGAPRDDRITTWMAGLGRSITEWVLLRADYRYEQRVSNLDRFDTDGHAFTVQLGVRLYRGTGRR